MNTSTEPAISIAGLTKSFGRTKALDGLDLSVAAGEVHGFLKRLRLGPSSWVAAVAGDVAAG